MQRRTFKAHWVSCLVARPCCVMAALLVPCAIAQTPEAVRQREYYRQQDQQREEQQRRAQEEYQRQLRATEDARKKQQESDDDRRTRDGADASARRAQAAPGGPNGLDMRALGKELMRLPPLPDERNVLLGRWRLEGGGAGTGFGETMDRAAVQGARHLQLPGQDADVASADAQQPNAYAPRSVPVYAAWFQLPCLQPARGPL
jgi:hypothetical protein